LKKFSYKGFVTSFNTILEKEWKFEVLANSRQEAVKKIQSFYKGIKNLNENVWIDVHLLKEKF
jgi:hypothetical protein